MRSFGAQAKQPHKKRHHCLTSHKYKTVDPNGPPQKDAKILPEKEPPKLQDCPSQ